LVVLLAVALVLWWAFSDDDSDDQIATGTELVEERTEETPTPTSTGQETTSTPPTEVTPDTDVPPETTAARVGTEVIRLEAEEGRPIPPIGPVASREASGGAYVASPDGSGALRLEFDAREGGEYRVWGRVATGSPALDKNSVKIAIDDGDADIWDFFQEDPAPASGEWVWELVSVRCGGDFNEHRCDPWLFELEPGPHTLVVIAREPDSRLDAFRVTNDPEFLP
jgi:hypothetical protein